jgi:hypothetical protein
LRCRFYTREKGEAKRNLCMAEVAIMGEAGEPCLLSCDEVLDRCVSEDFRNCSRFQWVEREKDKTALRTQF